MLSFTSIEVGDCKYPEVQYLEFLKVGANLVAA